MGHKKQKLILVRHGETEWNSAFRFQGQTDVPLGEEGRRQAVLLADRLGAVEFDRVYSSPLSRAFETASIIRKRSSFPMDIVTRPELSEMCFGTWEGLTLSEIQKNDPPLFLSWREDPSSVSPREVNLSMVFYQGQDPYSGRSWEMRAGIFWLSATGARSGRRLFSC